MKITLTQAIIAGITFLVVYAVYSFTHVSEGWEDNQGWLLLIAALLISLVLYFGTKRKPNR
ncbi:LPXTG cell wall anchor domain-containing protein [Adhaeribacter aquaticus]|uniref:LPXTG cell wall anchor domain-containing protein n=1 Tax=Adhaeribacter aquaticus TaxID=299567 RepID=UPI00041E855A|nr:LPXTG cell wall anchor domain-containing protein [Adhaeribacter aquaticus]